MHYAVTAVQLICSLVFVLHDICRKHFLLMELILFEPPREKTSFRGFRLGATQNGLYSHEAGFWVLVEEELYYPSSESKSADQLRSYCEADLRLCFRKG